MPHELATSSSSLAPLLSSQSVSYTHLDVYKRQDVQYIELYNEYNKLQTNGEKVSYIVATLSLRYGISERKVYDLIKRFKTDCNLCAV